MIKLIITNNNFSIEQILDKKLLQKTIKELRSKGVTGVVKIEEV